MIASNVFVALGNYLQGRECQPFGYGEAVFLTEMDRFLPDVKVVCNPGKVERDGVHGAPDPVVEVLSAFSARHDRCRKWDVYESCGVRELWTIMLGDQSVEVYCSKGGRFALQGMYSVCPDWQLARMSDDERPAVATHVRSGLVDDLEMPLQDVFARTS